MMARAPKFDVVKELAKSYEAYQIAKIKLNHYYTIRWNILRRMGRTGPRAIGSVKMDGQPVGNDVFNFEVEAVKLLEGEQTIADYQATIDEYENLFQDVHQMFEKYKNKKYMVLVLRMSGKTNQEIADELHITEERVRHIVVELNRELREKTEHRHDDTNTTL